MEKLKDHKETKVDVSHWEPYSTGYVALQLETQLRKKPWRLYSNNSGADPAPDREVTKRAKKEALLNIQGSLWSLQEQPHLLSRQ